MSGISVQGEQSTSSEITALANLTALSTSSAGQFLRKTGATTFENSTPAEAGLGDALTTNPLSQFAATTSLQLLGVISDETGSGSLVFGTAPTFATSITGSYLTASEILITDASKNIVSAAVATYPSLTELTYLKGVTSAIQTQLGTKAPTASPTFTGTVILPKTVEIQDTSADHQYVLAVSELAADRTVTLPLLTGADTFVFQAHTQTLTNKRITRRLTTTDAPGATPTTNTDNVDIMEFTGLATAITSMTTNLSGTPVDGDLLEFRFTDDGTGRGITWGASFASTTVTLPTTTVASTMLRVGFEFSGTTWKCIAKA